MRVREPGQGFKMTCGGMKSDLDLNVRLWQRQADVDCVVF